MFQLEEAIRLRMLPLPNPQERVAIDFAPGSTRGGWWSSRVASFTSAQWEQIRAQQQVFQGVLAWSPRRFNLATGGESRYVEGRMMAPPATPGQY